MQKGYPTCYAKNDTSSCLLPPSRTSSSRAAFPLLLLGWNGEWNMRGCTSKRWRDVKDLMLDVMAAPTRAWTVRIKSAPHWNYWTFSCQLECRQDLISSTELSLSNPRIREQKMPSKAVHDKIIPSTCTLNSYRSKYLKNQSKRYIFLYKEDWISD